MPQVGQIIRLNFSASLCRSGDDLSTLRRRCFIRTIDSIFGLSSFEEDEVDASGSDVEHLPAAFIVAMLGIGLRGVKGLLLPFDEKK